MSINKLRQGCILSDEDAYKLRLVDSHHQNVVLIISHDCDLVSESDEIIEVIIGTVVEKLNGQYENSRHPRCLHLKFCKQDGSYLCVELKHSDKKQIEKQKIRGLQNLGDVLMLPSEKKQVLQQWLAARYARPAFPNAFENRLRKKIGKKDNVVKCIEKILEKVSSDVLALYFDLGEEMSVELEEKHPYFLSISVVYDTIEGGPDARKHAEEIAESVKNIFVDTYGLSHSATDIALENCVAVGDNEIRLSDLRRVYQWRLEHLSLQDTPPSSLVMSGQFPCAS